MRFLILLIFLISCQQSEKHIEKSTQKSVQAEQKKKEKPVVIRNPNATKESDKNQKSANNLHSLPPFLDWEKEIKKSFCQSYGQPCAAPNLIPLGWSQNGNLAYLIKTESSATGTLVDLIVLNTQKDQELKRERWEGEPLESVWEKNFAKINEILVNYQITLQPNINLQTFPLQFKNDTYKISLKEKEGKSPTLQDQFVYIISAQKGKKEIYQVLQDIEFGIANSVFPGYLKSPFEDRIAVVKINAVQSLENEQFISIEFVGCHLETGFKK